MPTESAAAPNATSTYDLAAWRSAASAAFGQLDISVPAAATPRDFEATLRTVAVGQISLFDMHTPAHTVVRTPAHITASEVPYCKLSLQLAGTSTMTQDGRTCTLNPGDLALYVTQRPYTLSYPAEQHSLVVHFPQSLANLSPKQIEQITAHPISRDQGMGTVAVPLFEQIATHLDVLDNPHAHALISSALSMLVTTFSAELNPAPADSSTLLFNQARAYIEEHLADADLGPQTIAAALFVSVRHLHARFAAQDLSVGSYIRTRRLQAIRAALADASLAHEPINVIAARYGMFEPSHFSRAFKAEFGMSPKQFRTQAQ